MGCSEPNFDWYQGQLSWDAGMLRCAVAGKATPEQIAKWLPQDLGDVARLLLRVREVLLELNKPLCQCNRIGRCAVCRGRALISDMDAAATGEEWPPVRGEGE